MEHRESIQIRLSKLKITHEVCFSSLNVGEFDASKAPIESINIGRKCGRIMVTASDNTINVWSVGKRDPLFVSNYYPFASNIINNH